MRESSWYQPWVALAFFSASLNVVWELLAMSFYVTRTTSGTGGGIVMCLIAALGDVGITLVSYAVAATIGTRRWVCRPTVSPFAVYLAVGLVVTVASEYVNVYILHRWSYPPRMWTVAGVAVLPLVQWMLLPPIVLRLARRHLSRTSTVYETGEGERSKSRG